MRFLFCLKNIVFIWIIHCLLDGENTQRSCLISPGAYRPCLIRWPLRYLESKNRFFIISHLRSVVAWQTSTATGKDQLGGGPLSVFFLFSFSCYVVYGLETSTPKTLNIQYCISIMQCILFVNATLKKENKDFSFFIAIGPNNYVSIAATIIP